MTPMLIIISIAQDCMTSKWQRGHLNSYLTDSKTNTNDSTENLPCASITV